MGVGVSGDGPLCGPKKNNNKRMGVRNLSHLILIHRLETKRYNFRIKPMKIIVHLAFC